MRLMKVVVRLSLSRLLVLCRRRSSSPNASSFKTDAAHEFCGCRVACRQLVIKRAGEAVAYLGGIDITRDRWDTIEHPCATSADPDGAAACAARETEPHQTSLGWEDVHLRLRGPAVLDVAASGTCVLF